LHEIAISFIFQGKSLPKSKSKSLKALGALGAASKIDELLAALGDVSPFVRCAWRVGDGVGGENELEMKHDETILCL
jgi:hypothetical protein